MRRSRFVLAAVLSLSSTSLHAQSASDSLSMPLRDGFTEVSGWLLKTAEIVPAERYAYRPVAGVRTVGEMLAHIIDHYLVYCSKAAGHSAAMHASPEKAGVVDKPTLQRLLKETTNACTVAYQHGSSKQLMQNYSHATMHYGNLVTYMRLMGLTPPSS